MTTRMLFVMALIAWTTGVSQGFADEPTFDERLERLAEEIERNRVDLHSPGCALVVVRGDEVVFARGFGLAEIEGATPVTPETRFLIGSTTKAFTATLLGMLVDDGSMDWDDPVEKYLPYFTLAIDSEDEEAQVTFRDLLSHRTGIPRMSMLWASDALTSDEILHQAVEAEPFAPFRKRFYYNNVMYLAAGRAGAAAAGENWGTLISERILTPLGMNDSQTSIRNAHGEPQMARGYAWDDNLDEFKLLSPRPASFSVDSVAPAGSISSTALDMGKWIRFLLAEGVADGNRLISEEALKETWTEQIKVGAGVGYGMGWMMRDWQGQRLIVHDGAITGGFTALVALLPESDFGFALLSNAFPTSLPSIALNVVPNTLLGQWTDEDAETNVEDFGLYLGKYIANFAAFSNEVFTVLERNGHLALDIPSQMVYDLNPPDEDGKWQFTLTDQIEVSFERDDVGEVFALTMYQSGMKFEVLREGVEIEPEIDLDELRKYLGPYDQEDGDRSVTVLIQNQRLAIKVFGGPVFDLYPPDDEGHWVARARKEIWIAFNEAEGDAIESLEFKRPNGRPAMILVAAGGKNDSPLPTVEEIFALRQSALGGADSEIIENTRQSGVVRYPHAAVEGRFAITTAGDDRLRVDIDLGRFGDIQLALNRDRATRASSFEPGRFTELTGKLLTQTRQGHPSALYGDWREFFDVVTVLREDEFDGRKVYILKLQGGELPPTKLSVDAESGDVLRVENTVIFPGLGGLPVTTIHEDFREVHGMRIPYRTIESNDQTGRTVYVVEDFEINLDLDESVFVLHALDQR